MDSEHVVDLHAVPQVNVQVVEGAGERSVHRTAHTDVKDGEYSVCFERLGMGDLEVVDVVDVADEVKVTPSPPVVTSSGWFACRLGNLRVTRPTAVHLQVAAAAAVTSTLTRGERQGEGLAAPVGPHPHAAWQPTAPSPVSYCYLDWAPSEDSDDDEDVGLLDALDEQLQPAPIDGLPKDPQCSGCSRVLQATQSSKFSQTMDEGCSRSPSPAHAPSAPLPRSKLSINNVSVVSLPPLVPAEPRLQTQPQPQVAWPEHKSGQYDDVDEDAALDDEEDELSRSAPTPDNTPEHTPSEEHQHGLGLGVQMDPGSALYSTLKDMALQDESYSGCSTPTPDATPVGSGTLTLGRPGSGQQQPADAAAAAAGGGSTLGRVWSRLLGRASRTRTETAPASPPTFQHQQQQADARDSDSDDDDDERVVEVDPQTIDELEATLEEVRLDGDADDPVVSYLVEEVEDAVRAPGTTNQEVTVEEVHDDADEELSPPAPRPSGLLSRLFSKTRTSQDVSDGESAARRTRGSGAAKKSKAEAPARDHDRALHLHRFKPRQTNKTALRGALPRCLARWLRQGETGSWGAEGDAGAAESAVGGVSPRLGPRALRTPRGPPAVQLQRSRRPLGHAAHAPTPAAHAFPDEDCHVKHTSVA
ncbi:Midasin [Frankliniella fusca]|uniref:Midasin n=1 Tax=Frankliniella fusca TaxID=407009 RepID=A0AAE1I331_9NEOP|nr:Midasin [Frankliniella fusca]